MNSCLRRLMARPDAASLTFSKVGLSLTLASILFITANTGQQRPKILESLSVKRKSYKVCALLILLSLLALPAPEAHAGSYTVVYSGGHENYQDSDGVSGLYPYSLDNNSGPSTPYGHAGYGLGDYFYDMEAGLSMSGTITATFTWDNGGDANDLPPSSVLIHEHSYAAAGLDDYGLGAAVSVNAGLPVTFSTSDDPSGVNDKTLMGDKYTVKTNPGSSFQITCSPSASFDLTEGSYFGNAEVRYSAEAYPVTLRIDGTTTNPDDSNSANVLIGQGCTAYIMTDAPVTFSNFQWSIPGETFASYEMGNTVATTFYPSHPYGRVNYLSASDLTGPSPHWFWKKGGDSGDSQTVSCTAQASINGVSIGAVTGTKVVNVWQPYYECAASTHNGSSVISGHTFSEEIHANMEFEGAAGTPALFWTQYGAAGTWEVTQLCWIDRIWNMLWSPGGIGGPGNEDGTPGFVLDGEFNYASQETPPAPWPANSTKIEKMPFTWSDEPTLGPGAISQAIISDQFKVYQLYQPPGYDVQWVPLYEIDWSWNYDDYHYPIQSLSGTLTITNSSPTSAFPTWEGYYTGSNNGGS